MFQFQNNPYINKYLLLSFLLTIYCTCSVVIAILTNPILSRFCCYALLFNRTNIATFWGCLDRTAKMVEILVAQGINSQYDMTEIDEKCSWRHWSKAKI